MTTLSTSFTAIGFSANFTLPVMPPGLPPQTGTWSLSGTFVATVALEQTTNGGQTWQVVTTASAAVTDTVLRDPGTYRFHCTAFTSGTAVAVVADNDDALTAPPIVNQAGETIRNLTELGTATRWIRLTDEIWIISGTGTPTNGTSGTGATIAGPGSFFVSTSGAAYINTNTKASPTWAAFEAGGGGAPTGPAGGNLAGTYPNPTFNTAIVTAAALTVLDDVTVAAMVDTLGGAASTGTGGIARAVSPTFTTPNIGTATGNITGSAASITGSLVGDVTGTQGATVVSLVGGQTGANVAAGAVLANAAVSLNSPNAIVKRDSNGDFSAHVITSALVGNVTGGVLGTLTGNASTATVLFTARTINGVSFDGSANITVTAAGSTLSDAVPLSGLATQAAHTFVANATGSTAVPTAISVATARLEILPVFDTSGRIPGTLTNATTTITLYAPAAATITFLKTQLSAGTATVSLNINGTPVTGSSVSATTSIVSGTCTAANVVAAGDKITITVASVSSAADLDFTMLYTLT